MLFILQCETVVMKVLTPVLHHGFRPVYLNHMLRLQLFWYLGKDAKVKGKENIV